jgi:polar amino acid transport system substrate-binding protein
MPKPCRLLAALPALALCWQAWAAGPEEMVFVAPTNNTMPLVRFQGGALTGGILRDLGLAIAAKLGRTARFDAIPSKRVWTVLREGGADGVCYVMPAWAEGDFHWSRPLIPDGAVVAAHAGAPVVHGLAELYGVPIGTVLGYHYPTVEAQLGKGFVRDDGPTMEHNLGKLGAGRRQYALAELISVQHVMRRPGAPQIRIDIVFEHIKAHCAFSKRSRIPFAEVERAIDALLQEGTIERILAAYR